jgi:hypothetical protein
MELTTPKSVCFMILLPVIPGSRTRGVSGWSQVPALLSSVFSFINVLVIGDQAWFSTKPDLMMRVEVVL